MKAILVIDMPKNCAECHFNEVDDGCKENICRLLGFWKEPNFDDKSGRYEHCPLRPLPKKKLIIEDYYKENSGFNLRNQGWNDCLAEITGETE